ncbi:MAG: EcsC family protein [Pseudomonadota bacterium]
MVEHVPGEILPAPLDTELAEQRLDALADRYRKAGNIGIQLLNAIGGQAESLLASLPAPVRDRLGDTTESALRLAMDTAHRSRDLVAEQPGWLTRAITTTMGAAGGMGGLPSALAELPVTTTVLLRAIQDVAVEHGFDPAEAAIRYDCIEIFASAGPLEHDDGADLAFLSTRMTVTGPALQRLIASVSPRLAAVLGQKLAAQTVPVLGAAAGAATNYAYTRYYQQMAEVHFGLRRLAIDADIPHEALLAAFRARVAPPGVTRG